MLQRIVTLVFQPRHYWRSVSFDQIAELYVSRLIMVFAINIVNLFAAVYLYKLGYSVVFIAFFYAAIYAIKIPASVVIAKYAAYYGPKHGILAANIIRVLSMISFALVPQFGLAAIIVFGVLQQISAGMYNICYMIDFSKVKNVLNVGKEIGTMQIIEKVAKMISPIIGGVIATIWSPEATIILACILFAVAAVPLFRSVEPTPVKMKLKFAGFPWRLARATLISQSVVGFDFVASGLTWSLFMTIFIFNTAGDTIYSVIGFLASLGVFISIVASWTFGKMIDRRKGDLLLGVGAIANAVLHLFRPFTTTPAGVVGVNIVNETATSAYVMPFTRAMFDVADNSGARIVYMMYSEMTLNFGTALGCTLLGVGAVLLGNHAGFVLLFAVAAVYELLLLASTRQAK